MKLLLITDTKVQKRANEFYAFNSVVLELNNLHHYFSEIVWLAYDYSDLNADYSLMKLPDKRIQKFILLNRTGGNTLLSKINVGFNSIVYLFQIMKYASRADIIHVRGPSAPMLLSLLVSRFFKNKLWWFKYANNWVDQDAAITWKIQRYLLKKNISSIVTVNGLWGSEKHIISLENPCIENTISDSNELNQLNNSFLFVGRLDEKKGIVLVLDAFEMIAEKIKTKLTIIGDGELKGYVKERLANSKLVSQIEYIACCPKQEVINQMKKHDFLLLPSTASEGFPKVIAEAWSQFCLPITFNISAIGQYVTHYENGFITNNFNLNALIQMMQQACDLEENQLKRMKLNGLEKCSLFTYANFEKNINKHVISEYQRRYGKNK
jgi:glycosyltransferase involved in cell wall biosynthesis